MLFSLPISFIKILAFVSSFDQMPCIVFVQDMNLGSGNLMHNVCVVYTHPKIIFISSNAPPGCDFGGSIISSLGTSYS